LLRQTQGAFARRWALHFCSSRAGPINQWFRSNF
jgi:hypothetical protein